MIKLAINVFLCLFSIVVFLNSPEVYSYSFCFFVLMAYLSFNIIYLCMEDKNRVLSFEYIFMFSFLMTNFIYPVFYYIDNPYISLFAFSFDYSVISKATALALLGYSFYMLGNSNYRSIKVVKYIKIEVTDRVVFLVFLSSLLFLFLFILNGGISYYKDVYGGANSEAGLIAYLMVLLSVSTYLLSILIYNNDNLYFRILCFVYVFAIMILFLSTGARLFAISLGLLLLIQYSQMIRRIPLVIVTSLIFFGSFLMYLVQVYREEGVASSSFLTIISDSVNSKNSFFDTFMDLIINNRNLYVLVDFVDNNGFFYFLNVSASAFGVLPGVKTMMEFFQIPLYMTSGTLPTYLEFGSNASFGLGTNMVGEAYLSLGTLGVCLVFFCFGFLIKFFNNRSKSSIFYRIVFFFIASQAIFYPRIDYLWGIRIIVWMLVLYIVVIYLNKLFKRMSG